MAKGFASHEPPDRQGKTNHWLTPPEIIQDLGPFDLDPCAAPEPRPWNTARKHYAENGLENKWKGFIWCNPPYGEYTEIWLKKLSQHEEGGLALVFARTDTYWFQSAMQEAWALFLLRGRVRFHRLDGAKSYNNSGAPSCLIAFGKKASDRLKSTKLPGKFLVPL